VASLSHNRRVRKDRSIPLSDPLLTIESLGVRYGRVTGVSNVSLAVHEHEAISLVGPNGAGKTTTIRGIAGFLPREGARISGAVTFAGRRIEGLRPWNVARLGIRMIPAGTKVFAHLSVREHVRLARSSARGTGRDEDALALFPTLYERMDAAAASLSGGERQMLALALAMVSKPRLLIVDELSQGLAPAAVKTIANTLIELNRAGLTLIVVEQSPAVAMEVSGRYYALEAGQVTGEGQSERPPADGDTRAGETEAARPPVDASAAVVASPPSEGQGSVSGDPVIRVDDVTVRFRGIAALSGVSLEVHEGECLGLLGPNGAGKTSLLNVISRAITPTSGAVYVGGKAIAGRGPHSLATMGVARTFQSAELWQGMTVLDVVALGAHHLNIGRRAAEAQARESLAAVGLDIPERSHVGDLPYGYAKLVDLARALAGRPSILLLDEPASGLAQDERQNMVEVLRRVRRELNITQVLIEHDMQLVQRCCSRIVVLSHGEIIAEGDPASVLKDRRVAEELLGLIGGASGPDGGASAGVAVGA
jgi:ABC-type branched-subunit amino acid transport system ATPase component